MKIQRDGFTELTGQAGTSGAGEPRNGPYRVKCEADEFLYSGF